MNSSKGLALLRDSKKIALSGAPKDSSVAERMHKLFKQTKKKVADPLSCDAAICLLGVPEVPPAILGLALNTYNQQNVRVVAVIVHDAFSVPQGGIFFDIIHERDLWLALTGENPVPYRFRHMLGKLYGKYEKENINKILMPFEDHLSKLAGTNPYLTLDDALHKGIPSAQLVSVDEFLGLPNNMTCVATGADMEVRNFSYDQIRNKPLGQLTTPFILAIDVVPKNPDAKIDPTGDLIEPEQLAVIQQIEANLNGQKLAFKDFWDEKLYFNTYCAVNRQVVFLSINGKDSGRSTPVTLTSLPKSLGKLKSLRSLWLTDVAIEDLPQSFEDLENLEELFLLQTKLKRIGSLKKMRKLWRLNAAANQLEILPADIVYCEKLVQACFSNNPLNEADYALYQDATTYGFDEKEYLHQGGLARLLLELRQRATQNDPSIQLPPLADFLAKTQTQITAMQRYTLEWIKNPYFPTSKGIRPTLDLAVALVAVGDLASLDLLTTAFKEKVPALQSIADRFTFESLLKQGNFQEALQVAIAIDARLTQKENAPQPEFLVRAYIRLKDWDNAFKKLQEMDQNEGPYYYYGGIISVGFKMFDQAIQSFSYARDHWVNAWSVYTPEKAQNWITNVEKMKQSPT